MITLAKLKEFEELQGSSDVHAIRVRGGKKFILTYHELMEIAQLRSDVRLIKKGLAAKVYSDKVSQTLKEQCDSQATIDYLYTLADQQW